MNVDKINENRIGLEDTIQSGALKLAEGNPGAISAVAELIKHNASIDPDDGMPVLNNLLAMDEMRIYGTNIWVLFSDLCGKNIARMIVILRARQLGFISKQKLSELCGKQDRSIAKEIDVKEMYLKVKERLPNFDPNDEADYVLESEEVS